MVCVCVFLSSVHRLCELGIGIEEPEELLPRFFARRLDVVPQLEHHIDLTSQIRRHVHRVLLTIQEKDTTRSWSTRTEK